MPILKHTRFLEPAARALAAQYPRVLIRNMTALWSPIRLRRRLLADLEPRIVMKPEAFDRELEAWNDHGGLLLFDRDHRWDEKIAAHHAQLISECPLSTRQLDFCMKGTRELVVVFRPPSWEGHYACAAIHWPPSTICRRFWEVTRAAPLSESLRVALGIREPVRAITDEDAAAALGIVVPHLQRVRGTVLRKIEFRVVHPVTLRHPPEDRTLRAAYDSIGRAPSVDGVYFVQAGEMARTARNWRSSLAALDRRGSIGRKPAIGVYLPVPVEPNWSDIDATHQRGRASLEDVIRVVEASPEFDVPAPSPPDREKSRSASG